MSICSAGRPAVAPNPWHRWECQLPAGHRSPHRLEWRDQDGAYRIEWSTVDEIGTADGIRDEIPPVG